MGEKLWLVKLLQHIWVEAFCAGAFSGGCAREKERDGGPVGLWRKPKPAPGISPWSCSSIKAHQSYSTIPYSTQSHNTQSYTKYTNIQTMVIENNDIVHQSSSRLHTLPFSNGQWRPLAKWGRSASHHTALSNKIPLLNCPAPAPAAAQQWGPLLSCLPWECRLPYEMKGEEIGYPIQSNHLDSWHDLRSTSVKVPGKDLHHIYILSLIRKDFNRQKYAFLPLNSIPGYEAHFLQLCF